MLIKWQQKHGQIKYQSLDLILQFSCIENEINTIIDDYDECE